MPSKKPSPLQQAFLESRGITPPKTPAAWRNLINYIKNGNGTIGETESERIALAKAYTAKWTGKKIHRHETEKSTEGEGVVISLIALNSRDVQTIAVHHYDDENPQPLRPHPFRLLIRWHDRQPSQTSIHCISMVTPVEN